MSQFAYYKSTFGSVEAPYLVAQRQNSYLTGVAFQLHGRAMQALHHSWRWARGTRQDFSLEPPETKKCTP